MKQYIITDLPEGLVNITEDQLLEIGGENYDPIIVEEFVSKTSIELKGLATANELVKGQKYRITDYMTTYTQPVTNATKSSGIIEVLQLTAITTNSFATECRSELYPQDIVYYDINDVTEGFTKGKIFRRIDTLRNNDIGTDWRHVKYDRWGVDKLLFEDYTGCKDNVIKTYSLFNSVVGYNFYSNNIGNNFNSNNISYNFHSNNIGNDFNSNNIENNFFSNKVGNGFYDNAVDEDCALNTFFESIYSKTFPYSYQNRTVYGSTAVFPTNTSAEKMLVVDPITKELSEKLIPTPQTTADATNSAKGIVKLAGDLGGTADAPTVPSLSTKENTSNKVTTLTNNDTDYPTTKAVTTELNKKVSSVLTGEPAGATAIKNMVSLTQAQYDAGTKIATTLYIITDA